MMHWKNTRARRPSHPVRPPQARVGLLLIYVTYLTLAWAWNVTLPPYENLDELEHAEFVRHVVTTGTLPLHGQAEDQGYRVRQEASQPPLYYLLAAGWAKILRLPSTPHDPQAVPDRVVACGPSPTFYNKMTWIHPPGEAGLPWQGAYRTLHSLRLFSTLLQGLTLVGAWVLARRVVRDPILPLLVVGFIALNPQFLMVAAGVNNDNAVVPLATWGLVLALDCWHRGPSPLRVIGLGFISGLAALSKLSGFGLVGLGGLVLLIEGITHRRPFMRIVTHGLLLVIPAVLLVAPWLWRNQQLYGDPTALAPMLNKVGTRDAGVSLAEGWLMVRSYWGQLPCSFYPRALYWPFYLYVLGGLVGLVVTFVRRRDHASDIVKRALVLGALWFVTIVLAWMRWNRITFATGGRLLFPAASGAALLLALGWRGLDNRASRLWAAAMPLVSLGVLVFGMVPIAIAPPVREAPGPSDASFVFGDRVGLRSYRAEIVQPRIACALRSRSYCNPALELDLQWQTAQPPARDWTMVIQLVSPVPGETELRLNYNHWPGRGLLPTSLWPRNEVIHDHYLIPITQPGESTRAWSVRIAFVDPQTGERVPVQTAGGSAGDAAPLKLVRVPATHPVRPMKAVGEGTSATFSDSIRLLRAEVVRSDPESWQVILLWQSLASVSEDYTIFVHAYDEIGNLLATGDGQPLHGGFPTQLWVPGDRVETSHRLNVAEGDPVAIAVGLYNPATGNRLPAISDDVSVENNAVLIWQAP